jgi:putative ABC transport system substrate-binding protein
MLVRFPSTRPAVALALLFLAAPLSVTAQQQARVPRIGLLSPFSPADAGAWHQAFRQGLRNHDWVEGKNISIEYRYAEGRLDRLPDLAAELVRLKVDIIVTSVTPDALAAKKATVTIPIVMAAAGDVTVTGLVESLARPGGNITGLSQMNPELAVKRLDLLKEIVPQLSRVAVLWNPEDRISTITWEGLQAPARGMGIQLHSLEARSANDFGKAFEEATRRRAGALAIMPNPVFVTNLRRLADLAEKNRLPAIFHVTDFVKVGGLVAYGPNRSDLFLRAATYVDKILKGAKPAELPIEQPNKFELWINLKTAGVLGLTIPPSVLLRADQIIQ